MKHPRYSGLPGFWVPLPELKSTAEAAGAAELEFLLLPNFPLPLPLDLPLENLPFKGPKG